ncbi:polysaccharide biosynthesis/export family protein [Rhodobacteraceae bacterium B1Z28]|uniref:Polysaccharide biosynthesis/export family protein n=1 Tax=Ruegeria haliotis TaxID=2747601 RepID=A0ABX2PT14_9RHOB|nr:polysaccharide biosynthesis/export family protein [Ruegeria haliotis]NVO57330.1 polysaccharide biosynthesis/export family protein [Ruegeria haliotis]
MARDILLKTLSALRGIPRILGLCLLIAGGNSVSVQAETSTAATETLGPQQTISVQIGRWDSVDEVFVPFNAIAGSYQINANGTVSLPLIGSVQATGRTPDELGTELSQRLQDRMGLRSDVQTIVIILEFAPIYVLGDVKAPGTYPHVPGMTVLQALSLSGGINRASSALVRGERNSVNALGNYRVMELDQIRRLARLARLEAEEEGKDIDVPPELAASPLGAELIEQEREIMVSQQSAFASNLAQIEELEALLLERIARLQQQADLRQRQLSLLNEELENAASLVERGLSTVSRESDLQRAVTDQQVRLLEVETAQLSAEQQLSEARRDRLDLTNQRDRERVQGLQEQRAAIAELGVKMETEAALFAEAERTGNGLVELSALTSLTLQITRTGPDGSITFVVGRNDQITGGDVLEVVLTRPGPNGAIPVRRLSPETVGTVTPDEPSSSTKTQPATGLPPS